MLVLQVANAVSTTSGKRWGEKASGYEARYKVGQLAIYSLLKSC